MTFCITEIVCPNFPALKLNCLEVYTNHGESFTVQKQHIKKYQNTFSLAISSLSSIFQWNYTGLCVLHSFQKSSTFGSSSLIFTITIALCSCPTQFQTRLVPGTEEIISILPFLFLTALPDALVSLRCAFVTVSADSAASPPEFTTAANLTHWGVLASAKAGAVPWGSLSLQRLVPNLQTSPCL